MRPLVFFVLLIPALLLSACGGGSTSPAFPLDEGLTWQYRVSETTTLGKSRTEYAVENIGGTDVDGERRYRRRTSGGTEYQFRIDDDGVWRVAKRLVVELEAQADFPPRMVLPSRPEIGAQWQNTTHPYVLKRLVSDGIDMRRAYTVPMNYTIESISETVEVPAGRYENCIKVVGRADLQMYVDGPSGLRSIPLATEEWFARDVGLIKLRRVETVESDLMVGGELVMELLAFKPN